MTDELKPCPFCGQAAEVHYWGENGEHCTSDRDHYIVCGNDDCGASPGAVSDAAWNTRPIEEGLRAELSATQDRVNCWCGVTDELRIRCEALEAENAKLLAHLSEWQEAATNAYAENCPTDERHCACVAVLRGDVKRLQAELDAKRMTIDELMVEVERCGECGRRMTHVRPGKWQCDNCKADAAYHAVTGDWPLAE